MESRLIEKLYDNLAFTIHEISESSGNRITREEWNRAIERDMSMSITWGDIMNYGSYITPLGDVIRCVDNTEFIINNKIRVKIY